MNKLYLGYCLDIIRAEIEDNSIDTIITDPPYGISFMGKKWDYNVPDKKVWEECLRVLKPGGTALIFAGARTQHRMAVEVEDSGFILKDCILWIYGTGFPKGLDINKHINRELWEGWKSHSLKPAYEPILMAMKPNDGTYAQNVLKWGVSGLNIDGSRICLQEHGEDKRLGGKGDWSSEKMAKNVYGEYSGKRVSSSKKGRFPANIILDEKAARILDLQSKSRTSRFFYVAKSSKKERNIGCDGLEGGNGHPTVKPLELMEYLCILTKTPTGGIVLDPFAGSGTTGIACQNTNREYILIEKDPRYVKIAKARLKRKI